MCMVIGEKKILSSEECTRIHTTNLSWRWFYIKGIFTFFMLCSCFVKCTTIIHDCNICTFILYEMYNNKKCFNIYTNHKGFKITHYTKFLSNGLLKHILWRWISPLKKWYKLSSILYEFSFYLSRNDNKGILFANKIP